MRIAAIIAAVAGFVFLFASNSHTAYAEQAQSNKIVTADRSVSQTVTVQPGDYLAKLAETYQTTIERLFDANTQINDPNLIYPGEQLQVPSADEQLTPRSMTVNTTQIDPSDSDSDTSTTAAPSQVVTQITRPTGANPSQGSSVWDSIAQCESDGNWQINTGNGYYGGLQFTLNSWHAFGGTGYPNQASRDEQIAIAQKLQSAQGWHAWPTCSARLGL